MNSIISKMQTNNKFTEFIEDIKNKKGPICVSGLSDVYKAQLIGATKENLKNICLIITYNEIQAKKIYDDVKQFEKNTFIFNKKDIVTYDYEVESYDNLYERIKVLNELNKKCIVITTIEAAMQKMIPKEVLYKNKIKLKVGDTIDTEELKEKLISMGDERTELTEGNGQFCIRGGIIDISISENLGVRIELWGDDIDSIRYFNLSSQRSTEMAEKVEIIPLHEYLLETDKETVCNKILDNNYTEKQQENAEEDVRKIKEESYVSKVDKYIDYFYSKTETILDYLPQDTIILIDEKSKVEARKENIKNDYDNLIKSLTEREKIIPQILQNSKISESLEENINLSNTIYLENQDKAKKIAQIEYNFNNRQINYFKSEIESFVKDINNNLVQNKEVIILVENKEKAKKLSKILTDFNVLNSINEKNADIIKNKENIAHIEIGKLSSGFEDIDNNLVVIDANNVIDSDKRKRRSTHSSFKEGEKVVFADLKAGDFVVHKNHGIGEFIGVNTITADGVTKDYIKIKYKNDDVLYVPTNQLDTIRKFVGGGERIPKVNRLGGKEWEQTKARVKKNLREVAKELIELYAKRQKVQGYAFSKDTPWQTQFENSFPYQETDDQLRCIEEVKKDMEKPKPMDRLLCGDVGYGKTEVAIRAAFKAVMDQKQVAYLVPTTVLADQQYESFKERMEEFPIRVEVLNRFKTKKEQNAIIKKLKLGEVDVVIGTHRLLSKDVEFKDLGLLIIDEEHRFGVKAKEKIKEYKTNVDVLTMTATPIPRTLHMSIVGVRDMSIIYEPPQNRKPVQTYVIEYDEEVVKEAITKELERGGQVFYLFNNVEGIERKAIEISNLVPEAKVSYAHGKMTGSQLEDIMKEFIDGETNVLVCTTILESGIDIPNANTIIVENADRLGLAQLYQIRGRVGRSGTQAYAYITYKRAKILSEVSDKRLKAIKEFTQFGSGFKIAMRDLEIRGAGSLLRRNTTWTYGTSWI
jgi:transcription-repair coupling factor (superfamily II helicase)